MILTSDAWNHFKHDLLKSDPLYIQIIIFWYEYYMQFLAMNTTNFFKETQSNISVLTLALFYRLLHVWIQDLDHIKTVS